jgi:hypothetical protein
MFEYKTIVMLIIQLKISDKAYNKFLWLLSKFSKDEIEIISEDPNLYSTKSYLQKEHDEIQNGNANFLSIEELESRLDLII